MFSPRIYRLRTRVLFAKMSSKRLCLQMNLFPTRRNPRISMLSSRAFILSHSHGPTRVKHPAGERTSLDSQDLFGRTHTRLSTAHPAIGPADQVICDRIGKYRPR